MGYRCQGERKFAEPWQHYFGMLATESRVPYNKQLTRRALIRSFRSFGAVVEFKTLRNNQCGADDPGIPLYYLVTSSINYQAAAWTLFREDLYS